MSLADQIDQIELLFRGILEIRILDHDDVAGDGGESAPERGALPAFGWRIRLNFSVFCRLSRILSDPSVDPSSTTISSMRRHGQDPANDGLDRVRLRTRA